MKINFTKQQYKHLMRAMYFADWVTNAVCVDDEEKDKGIQEISDHVYSFAKEFGFEKYVELSKSGEEYYTTNAFDEELSVRNLINRYDDEAFWGEISDRLGERDFHRRYSDDEIQKLSDEERFIKLQECIIPYEIEMEENGLEKLELLKTVKDYEL